MYKTGIYIGKFYPFHNGHLEALKEQELDYPIDERINDVKQIVDEKVEIIKFIKPDDLQFPKDYLKIKCLLLKQIENKK